MLDVPVSTESDTVDTGPGIAKQECSEGLNMRFPLWARVGKGGFLGRGIMGHHWGRRKGTLGGVPSLLSTFLLPAIGACGCVCYFDCEVYLAPLPPGFPESMSCPPLEFIILRGVYVAVQHLPFILLSIDILLPRKELSLSLRCCSNGSFFIALGSPFISLQFASGTMCSVDPISFFDLCLVSPLDFL